MAEQRQIPVYLFTGFLEAGKTKFIQETLEDKRFNNGEPTLLLVCEEGIEEFEPEEFSGHRVKLKAVEEESDLTPENLEAWLKAADAERVLVEYNGMWMMEPLYRDGLPGNWVLYQIICLMDARTFEPYLKNMGQLVMEKVSNADMLIFNRCNEQLRADLRSKNLRMANRRADIYLENEDGTSEEYVTEDMMPFDLSSGHLEVADEDYGIWYVDLMDHPERYEGVSVTFKALMCHSKKFKGVDCPGRFAMVCCENDMQFLALVCKGQGMDRFKNRDWVKIHATVKKENCEAYQGQGPVLYVDRISACQKPEPETVSF